MKYTYDDAEADAEADLHSANPKVAAPAGQGSQPALTGLSVCRTSINDVGGVRRDQEAAGVQVPVQQRLPPLREQHLDNELDTWTLPCLIFPELPCVAALHPDIHRRPPLELHEPAACYLCSSRPTS